MGNCVNELVSDYHPYTWIIEGELYEGHTETELINRAYIMLGAVQNLDAVEFRIHENNDLKVISVTAQEASESLGYDIKECYEDISLLNQLCREIRI